MKEIKTITPAKSTPFFKIAYVLFLVLVCYNVYMAQYETALANFSIALIFDPFNTAIKWTDRPLYQKVWLFAHCIIAIIGLATLLIIKS